MSESSSARMHGDTEQTAADTDTDTASAAVDSFLKALATGNEKEAEKWLAPDVLIYEAGHAETSRAEYTAQHLKGDIAFLSKAKMERLERAGNGGADIAWVASRSRIHGQSAGKPIDVLSTETMVLKHTSGGWRIQHIQWSSADEE